MSTDTNKTNNGSKPVLRSDWMCIQCGHILGKVLGGELNPLVEGKFLRTSGPNLQVICPECGATKTWYTSDPVVRAVYQLVGAISDVAARSMVEQIGRAIHEQNRSVGG